jgi:uroporphyrinogen-III decarboxylase
MLMSPEMWRFYFKERMATIIREVKEVQPEIVVAYHTDGSNFPILDDLVEIGLDALNPIQPESMDRATVAEKYEEKLGFFGVIDVQEVLPSGSPEDVAEEFQSARATLGRNGRWICAPTHHVQIDTPMKNFLELRKQATGLS